LKLKNVRIIVDNSFGSISGTAKKLKKLGKYVVLTGADL
jgi:hypothetical protein